MSVRTHAIPESTNPESAKGGHSIAQRTTINGKIEERKLYINAHDNAFPPCSISFPYGKANIQF